MPANLSTTETGLVFNIQKYSVEDGPGIRTTVFLKGCPLCCAWCHNPESQSARPQIIILETRCIACGECRRACPFGDAIQREGPLPPWLPECNLCGACIEACPTGARQMIGQKMSATTVMDEVLRDRVFYEESGGGVTFSGGEPLTQPAFLKTLLKSCRAHGIHTAVDTCGFGCTETLLEIAGLSDLVLFDVKLMDEARHRQYTGVSNGPILENLRRLDRVHDRIWLRIPVIPGINDGVEDLKAIADFAATLRGVRQINLLPYHKIGLSKFRRLNQSYPLEGVEAPSAERMEGVANLFREAGLAAKVGG